MAFINSTLILQAAHFIIAFYLIKYFLFRPVFAYIETEDALQESLVSAIQEHQAAVAHKEHDLAAHWQMLRLHFAQNVPSLKMHRILSSKAAIVMPQLASEKMQTLAQEVAKKLVSQVDHVA